MKTSETITKIAPALLKAQKAIKAALKDSTNPHFKSKYADLSSVIDAVKEPLNANGIMYLQGVEDAENGVAVETMLLHESGEWLSSTIKIPATKHDAQGYGSATTYARRYGLQAMCGVPAEDDDGNAASKPKATITPTTGAWEALPVDEQTFLSDLADEVRKFLNDGDTEGAKLHLEAANLGTEEKVAIWTRFDSKERAALKKQPERKAA